MYVLGVDSGTQGTKVLVVEAETGRVLGRGAAPHALVPGLKPGENEQDPRVWVAALEQALGIALAEAKIDPGLVAALGVSGQQHGFVPLDQDGAPVRPAKLWNDTSTVEETEALVAALGGPAGYIEKLGIALAVGFTASKILWLKKHEPANFRRLATVLLPHNYLNYALTGIRQMEYGDASGTGLMDIRTRAWNDEAVAAVDPGLKAALPALHHPREAVGYVKDAFAAKFGLKKVLVASGGGDNMMGAIGTGNVAPGICTLSLGTSGTVYSHFAVPFSDPEGEIAAFCDSTGGWLPLLCTMNVTNTTEMIKALFHLGNAELEALAGQAPAGADGLLFHPFLDGERVPVLPEAGASFFGLTRRNFDAAHLARATMEGTVFNLGYGFARMRGLGLTPTQIRATGGGAKSRLWLQIVADVFRTPVVTLREQEAAAYGAAIQAIWNYETERGRDAGIEDLAARMVLTETPVVEPRPENFAIYAELQDRFNSLWKTLKAEYSVHRKLLDRI
jgi:xylulokinase